MTRILIVEDSPTMRSLLGSSLEEIEGPVKLVEVASGFEALRTLPRQSFDLIVTDINMPDINGLELVSFVKNNPAYREIPFIIVSTEGSERDREKGLQPRGGRLRGEALRARGAARGRELDLLARSATRGTAETMAQRRSGAGGRRGRTQGPTGSSCPRPRKSSRPCGAPWPTWGTHDGAESDPELVNRLFRAAHSLKALAGLFQFEPIQGLAHRLEDVLDGLRLGRVQLSAVLGPLDEAIEIFATLLAAVGDAEAMAGSAGAIADLVTRIASAARGEVAAVPASSPPSSSIQLSSPPSRSTRSIGCARACAAAGASPWSMSASTSRASRRGCRSSRLRFARRAR